jgi:diguanylate cyclase (GGDEF)-like protein
MAVLFEGKRDFLTNCFTRDELGSFLDRVFIESRMYNQPVSILLIDVDKFKHFNDKYGHLCGDEILKYFSSTLRLSLDETEHYPFRYGGDEFVIVFPKRDAKETHMYANKFSKNIKNRHFLLKGRLFKMSFSGGIATFPTDADSMDKLLEKADKAMYFSKKHYQGTTTQYNGIAARRLSEITVAAAVLLLLVVLFFGREYIVKGKIREVRIPGGKKGLVSVTAPASTIKIKEEQFDTVYLKSGGAIKGIVTRQGPTETEIRLKMDQGEGLLIFKNSDIQSIEKGKR